LRVKCAAAALRPTVSVRGGGADNISCRGIPSLTHRIILSCSNRFLSLFFSHTYIIIPYIIIMLIQIFKTDAFKENIVGWPPCESYSLLYLQYLYEILIFTTSHRVHLLASRLNSSKIKYFHFQIFIIYT